MPEALHRRLKARAAMEGVSMSRYVLREIERSLERPTRRELLEAIASQPEKEAEPLAGRNPAGGTGPALTVPDVSGVAALAGALARFLAGRAGGSP